MEVNGVHSSPYLGNWVEHCHLHIILICVELIKYAGNPKQNCREMQVSHVLWGMYVVASDILQEGKGKFSEQCL